MAPPEALSLTERLAARCARPVDGATRERARLHLLDWLGCIAGGLHDPGPLQARGDWREAAALLGNVLEMDDVHRGAILHPGPVVWPVVFGTRATMDAVLDAAVRGYEAMISVGATFDAHHYAHFHNSATAGVFGAAAAAWSLGPAAGDPQVLASAFGLAGSVAGGVWRTRHEPGHAKQWHTLNAVRVGVDAARLAADGLIGPRCILEGAQGLYDATCATPRPDRLLGGDRWRLHEVSFKPWGACRHAHPAIDAALELRRQGVALDSPIRVETYRDALAFCDRPVPRTVAEAKFSLQHAVAVAVVRGEPQLADFEADAIADPLLAAVRAHVSLAEMPEFTARFPDHFGARVTCGGAAATVVDTLGDPERPLDSAGIAAKARALMVWGGVGDETELAFAAAISTAGSAVPDFGFLAGWLDRPGSALR